MHLCQSLFLQACLENFSTEAIIWRCSAKMVFLKILQNSQVYNCARVSCLIKLQALAQHRKFQYRSSCPEVFCKNGVLKIFAKFTEIHLCQSLFFSKVAGFRPAQKILVQKQQYRSSRPEVFCKNGVLLVDIAHIANLYYHGTRIQTGITCTKILCYICNSACRWFIGKKAKIF